MTGSYYVQTEELVWEAFALSVPVGLLAAAILVVNNVRDVDTDRRAGKRTLAVKLGRERARALFVAMLVLAFAVPLGRGGGRRPLLVAGADRCSPGRSRCRWCAPCALAPTGPPSTRRSPPPAGCWRSSHCCCPPASCSREAHAAASVDSAAPAVRDRQRGGDRPRAGGAPPRGRGRRDRPRRGGPVRAIRRGAAGARRGGAERRRRPASGPGARGRGDRPAGPRGARGAAPARRAAQGRAGREHDPARGPARGGGRAGARGPEPGLRLLQAEGRACPTTPSAWPPCARRSGPWPALRLDANAAWSVDDAVHAIRALEGHDLEFVEQPCAHARGAGRGARARVHPDRRRRGGGERARTCAAPSSWAPATW